MLYLCQINTAWPPELGAAARQALLEREWERGRDLRRLGKIAAIWRVEGRSASVSLWQVESQQELQDLLASLPLSRYQTVEVHTLTAHPVMTEVNNTDV